MQGYANARRMVRGGAVGGPRGLIGRARLYPRQFLRRHPLRAAKNLVGNHPSPLASRHLAGLRGVEIGGTAHNSFFLDTVNVDRVAAPPTWMDQWRCAGRILPVDVVSAADDLPFADDAYGFVLASHVLEHMPDPIGALEEWARVASRYVLVLLPQPDNEFDRGRPLTTFEELVERHETGYSGDVDRHYSVWSSETFADHCTRLGFTVRELQDPDDKRGNGFALLLGVPRPRAR